jgi:hypothetical protein
VISLANSVSWKDFVVLPAVVALMIEKLLAFWLETPVLAAYNAKLQHFLMRKKSSSVWTMLLLAEKTMVVRYAVQEMDQMIQHPLSVPSTSAKISVAISRAS